ncbi:MAG: GerMN domain-containing protein [Lachnospiraceae bacterium]
MNKKAFVLIMSMVLAIGIIACNSKKETESVKKQPKAEQQKEEDTQTEQPKTEQPKVERPKEEQPAKDEGTNEKKVITIYFSNSDATGFEKENLEIPTITPEILLENLIAKKALPTGVTVVSCQETRKDGEKAIDLDLSQNFGTYVNTLGTSGEYIAIGSVCNTFLNAYSSQKIHVTVAGNILETGHAEYPGYMGVFQ